MNPIQPPKWLKKSMSISLSNEDQKNIQDYLEKNSSEPIGNISQMLRHLLNKCTNITSNPTGDVDTNILYKTIEDQKNMIVELTEKIQNPETTGNTELEAALEKMSAERLMIIDRLHGAYNEIKDLKSTLSFQKVKNIEYTPATPVEEKTFLGLF
jgi:DNA primase catalytic subunit